MGRSSWGSASGTSVRDPSFPQGQPLLTRAFADAVLDNENVKIDFKPLYTCIHIYDTLDAREELQLSYQADRRVRPRAISRHVDPLTPSRAGTSRPPPLVHRLAHALLPPRALRPPRRDRRLLPDRVARPPDDQLVPLGAGRRGPLGRHVRACRSHRRRGLGRLRGPRGVPRDQVQGAHVCADARGELETVPLPFECARTSGGPELRRRAGAGGPPAHRYFLRRATATRSTSSTASSSPSSSATPSSSSAASAPTLRRCARPPHLSLCALLGASD